MFRHLRFDLFQGLLKPFSRFSRKRRAMTFVRLMQPWENMRILDVGGQPQIWDYVEIPLSITCLNLPGKATSDHPTHHAISYVTGDGRNLSHYQRGDFDLVFSNSVIEHVGGHEERKAFAAEIQRLSDNFWVQTPSQYFPIEAHCGMPYWWFYPESWRHFFLTRWKVKLPVWTEMIEGTVLVTRRELEQLFPDANLLKEWFILPKSEIAYSRSEDDLREPR